MRSNSSLYNDSPQIVYRIETYLNLKSITSSTLSDSVEIITHLHIGFERRTQIVIVKSISDMWIVNPKLAAGEEIVAKIYDPMYDVEERIWLGGSSSSMVWSKENETRATTD